MKRMLAARLSVAILAFTANHAVAELPNRTYEVGANREFRTPGAVASTVHDGDTVRIDAGEYHDCAVWTRNRLLIEGVGKVVLTDTTCQGKAIFVTVGSDITIRNLTFQRARVPDENGAGIRVEGANLTVESSQFLNNENGIMSGAKPDSRIVIRNSRFVGNGKCAQACSHGIYIGAVASLHIERSTFQGQKQGHHIKSRAARTEIIGCTIEDGRRGTASYLVEIPNGGSLFMRDNVLEKGPLAENHSAAISIGAEGVRNPTDEIVVERNSFRNDMVFPTNFVHNLTATPAKLVGNKLSGRGKITPLKGDGTVRS